MIRETVQKQYSMINRVLDINAHIPRKTKMHVIPGWEKIQEHHKSDHLVWRC